MLPPKVTKTLSSSPPSWAPSPGFLGSLPGLATPVQALLTRFSNPGPRLFPLRVGGTTGFGGSSGATGQLTPQDAVKLMAPGWNLGNSFDADPNETGWGNPTPTQTLINAVHSAGFKTLRLPVTWTKHIGGGPVYTIDAAWMAKVTRTAQWAVDAGMYVFVNTHHEADGNGGWVPFPSTSAAQGVATEVTAVWSQIATAFKSFDSHLMFECFNEPNEAGGGNTPQAQTDLNMYLEACFKAIRDTGGANATRIVMIQPIGASPIQSGIQSMQKVSFINDPNLVISLHTYFPTNFGLNGNQVNWGSVADYTTRKGNKRGPGFENRVRRAWTGLPARGGSPRSPGREPRVIASKSRTIFVV